MVPFLSSASPTSFLKPYLIRDTIRYWGKAENLGFFCCSPHDFPARTIQRRFQLIEARWIHGEWTYLELYAIPPEGMVDMLKTRTWALPVPSLKDGSSILPSDPTLTSNRSGFFREIQTVLVVCPGLFILTINKNISHAASKSEETPTYPVIRVVLFDTFIEEES